MGERGAKLCNLLDVEGTEDHLFKHKPSQWGEALESISSNFHGHQERAPDSPKVTLWNPWREKEQMSGYIYMSDEGSLLHHHEAR